MKLNNPQMGLCKGYLHKKTKRGVSRWKLRHFRWDGNVLSCHLTGNNDSKARKNYLASNFSNVTYLKKFSKIGRHVLCVEFKDNTPKLILAAKTIAQCENWLEVLSLANHHKESLSIRQISHPIKTFRSKSEFEINSAYITVTKPSRSSDCPVISYSKKANTNLVRVLTKLEVRSGTLSASEQNVWGKKENIGVLKWLNQDQDLNDHSVMHSKLGILEASRRFDGADKPLRSCTNTSEDITSVSEIRELDRHQRGSNISSIRRPINSSNTISTAVNLFNNIIDNFLPTDEIPGKTKDRSSTPSLTTDISTDPKELFSTSCKTKTSPQSLNLLAETSSPSKTGLLTPYSPALDISTKKNSEYYPLKKPHSFSGYDSISTAITLCGYNHDYLLSSKKILLSPTDEDSLLPLR